MIDWSDETPSIDEILGNVSIYWFTGCYPSSIWPYRGVSNAPSNDEIFVAWTLTAVPYQRL